MKDLISRKAAINGKIAIQCADGVEIYSDEAVPVEYLKALPSAQPEPEKGHWILRESYYGDEQYECSQCGVIWEFTDGTPKENDSYYCPHCGARMKGVLNAVD